MVEQKGMTLARNLVAVKVVVKVVPKVVWMVVMMVALSADEKVVWMADGKVVSRAYALVHCLGYHMAARLVDLTEKKWVEQMGAGLVDLKVQKMVGEKVVSRAVLLAGAKGSWMAVLKVAHLVEKMDNLKAVMLVPCLNPPKLQRYERS